MNQQKKDKARLGAMMAISLAVIVTALLYAFSAGIMDNPMVAVVTLITVGIAVFILVLAAKALIVDIKAGIPIKDERSKRVMEKAAASTFLFMIYFLLALGWYSDMDGVDIIPRHISSAGILGGTVFLFIMWAYYNWRGVDA